jgi:Flp pilus assembly protein TadD
MRGFANASVKNNTQAMSDLNKAIELNPSNAGAYFARGKLYLLLNNKTAGKADLTKSAALGDREAAFFMKAPTQKHRSSPSSDWVVWKK